MSSIPQHILFLESESTQWGRVTAGTTWSLADETIPTTPPYSLGTCPCGWTQAHHITDCSSTLLLDSKYEDYVDCYTTSIQALAIMWMKSSIRTHCFFFRSSFLHVGIVKRQSHPQVHISFFAFTYDLQIFLVSAPFSQSYVKTQCIKFLKENFVGMMSVRSQCIMLTSKTKKKEQWGFVMNAEIWNQCKDDSCRLFCKFSSQFIPFCWWWFICFLFCFSPSSSFFNTNEHLINVIIWKVFSASNRTFPNSQGSYHWFPKLQAYQLKNANGFMLLMISTLKEAISVLLFRLSE